MGRKKTTVASPNQPQTFALPDPAPVAVERRARRTAATIAADTAKSKRIEELQRAILEAQQFVALHSEARAEAERNVRAAKKKVNELQSELVRLMMPF